MTPESALSASGVSKSYGGVPVLIDVDLEVRRGEVHAVIGENGAGKSTLARILAGVEAPDAGSVRLGRQAPSPEAGVGFVMQELNLIDTLSVAESLFLDRLPHRFGVIDRRRLTQYVGARVEVLNQPLVFGLSAPFLAAVALVAAGQFVLSRTVFGRYAAAIGANEEAVRLSGIDPRRVKLAVFMISGACAGLAGIVYSARLSSSDPNAAVGFELQVIAAVVVGGTSLMGGRASVVGSFLGVLIIAVLGSGLAQAGAQEPTKRLVTGAVIVAAVVVDHLRHGRQKPS